MYSYLNDMCTIVNRDFCNYVSFVYAKQKQPGYKKSVRPIRSHNGYK